MAAEDHLTCWDSCSDAYIGTRDCVVFLKNRLAM